MIFTKCSHAIANQISPEAAWVFGVIDYWSTANARKKNPKSLKNGLYCMFMSLPAFQKELPFIKRSALQGALIALKEHGLIAAFTGDANSNRANYYAVDQKGWLKFQAWSSGYTLSAEDGRALTPIEEQVPDAQLEVSYPVATQQIDDPILLPDNMYPVAPQQHILLPHNSMPHTLDIKSKNKEFKKNNVATRKLHDAGAKDKTAPEGARVFEAYARAYEVRYGCPPIRNLKVNSICKRAVTQLGEEAIALVEHYVGMNKRWYVERSHSLECFMSDVQAVRTSYLTGRTMTSTRAAEIDKEQSFRETIYGIERQGAAEFDIFEGVERPNTDYLASPKVLRERALTAARDTVDTSASPVCEEVPLAKPSGDS